MNVLFLVSKCVCSFKFCDFQITVVIDRILAFSLSSPLAKFLNGLEILLSKSQARAKLSTINK